MGIRAVLGSGLLALAGILGFNVELFPISAVFVRGIDFEATLSTLLATLETACAAERVRLNLC